MGRRNHAVTLIEVLITTVLMFVVITAMIVLQEMGDKFFKSTSEKSSLQANSSYAMGRMVRSIHESRSAQILGAGTGLRLSDQYNNTIEFSLDNDTKILYYSDTGNSISNEVLAKGVSLLNFLPDSINGRSISIALRIELKGRSLELSSRATLRNP